MLKELENELDLTGARTSSSPRATTSRPAAGRACPRRGSGQGMLGGGRCVLVLEGLCKLVERRATGAWINELARRACHLGPIPSATCPNGRTGDHGWDAGGSHALGDQSKSGASAHCAPGDA